MKPRSTIPIWLALVPLALACAAIAVPWSMAHAPEIGFALQRGFANDQWAVDRGAPPPTRNIPGQPFSKPPPMPQGAIIGLFPEPGGSR